MYPYLQVKSTESDEFLENIIDVIESVDCEIYFSSLIGRGQGDQKTIVERFQKTIYKALLDGISSVKWSMEYSPSNSSRDSIDIFGKNDSLVVAIELDKHRADQVAKKFVSRMAILPFTKVYYISLCYPGTKKMSKPETIKYFNYCSILARKMTNIYAGFTVESKT